MTHRAFEALLLCKQRARELTRRTQGISLQQMTKNLASYLLCWKKALRLLSDAFWCRCRECAKIHPSRTFRAAHRQR